MSDRIKEIVTLFYAQYEGATPETYFGNLRKAFTVEGVGITEEQETKCQEILSKYEGKRLYAYCCGSIIPTPSYHDTVCNELIEELCDVILGEE